MGSYTPNPEAPHIPQPFHLQLLKASKGFYRNLPASTCELSPTALPAPSSPTDKLCGLPVT